MKELQHEVQGTNTYLVYRIQEEDSVDTMSLGMLTNNRISGLAQTIFMQLDNQKSIKYNISSKVPVSELMDRDLNKRTTLGILNGIVDALQAAESYMLDPRSILIDREHIFVDMYSGKTELICLPVSTTDADEQPLTKFLRDFMYDAKHDITENTVYATQIENYLKSTPAFSLTEFQKILESVADAVPVTSAKPVMPGASARPAPASVSGGQQPSVPVSSRKPVLQQPVLQQPVPQQPVSQPAPQTLSYAMPSQQIPQTSGRSDSASEEEPISFFYLMQHYNKERAAAYKRQKEERKNAKKMEKGMSTAEKKAKKQKSGGAASGMGFAIPGQEMPAMHADSAVPSGAAGWQPSAPAGTPAADQPVYVNPPAQQGTDISFGQTTVLGAAGGGTTVLTGGTTVLSQQRRAYLIRQKTGERYEVVSGENRIGSERSYANCCYISDNSAISRSHAKIVSTGAGYELVDVRSTNHTYVNNRMINPNEPVSISGGDRICFADEQFDFVIQ